MGPAQKGSPRVVAHFAASDHGDSGASAGDTSTAGRGQMPREVWVLSAMTFLTALGFGLIGPALPALASMFDISTTLASLAISGFAAFRLAANLGFSGLLKRFRLRSVLFLGLAVQALCSILAGLAVDGTMFLLFRSLSGLGSAALTVSATALLLAVTPARLRGRATSTYFGAASLGAITGPAIGGFLAIADPRLPLLIYGGCLAVASAVSFFLLREVRDLRTAEADATASDGGKLTPWALARQLISNPLFATALWCHFAVGWTLYGMRTTTVPLYLGIAGWTTALIGIAMTVAAVTQVIGSAASGTASDRFGRLRPLILGVALGMIAFGLVALSSGDIPVFIAFVLMGLANGALATVPAAMIGDVPLGGSGMGVALYWMVFDIAAIIGPIVSGIIADTSGFTGAFVLAQWPFVACIVSAVVAARWQRRQSASV